MPSIIPHGLEYQFGQLFCPICALPNSSTRKTSERVSPVQTGRMANTAIFTTLLIMNLNLDSGMYKIPIENGVKKVDGGSTQGNISHKNLLEGAVKKIVLQVFQ